MNSLPDCVISEEILPHLQSSFFRNVHRLACVSRRFRSLLHDWLQPRMAIILDINGYNIWNQVMHHAAASEFEDLIGFSIEKGASDWEWALAGASSTGRRDLIDFFIQKDTHDREQRLGCTNLEASRQILNWEILNWGMFHAKDRETAQYFVDMGASDWSGGLERATRRGDMDLVRFFEEMGADIAGPCRSVVGWYTGGRGTGNQETAT